MAAHKHNDLSRVAQICIAPVSFPEDGKTLQDVLTTRADGSLATNLQSLIESHGDRSSDGQWSVPPWFAKGDILLFYHSKRALPRIKRFFYDAFQQSGLYASRQKDGSTPIEAAIAKLDDRWRPVVELLVYEYQLAVELQGTIFASARVTSRATADTSDDERARLKHWRSRVYGDIRDVYVFAAPLPASEFTKYVALSTGGGFTPVQGAAFEQLRKALARDNRLPKYLARVTADGRGFQGVTRRNWRDRLGSPSAPRFLDESQVRAYFADFLLADLKDERTTVFEECRCSASAPAPIADYFVRIAGRWYPVETKINVRSDPRLTTQVQRYLGISDFIPLKGSHAGKRHGASGAELCLVIDAEGLYVLGPSGFVGGSMEKPLLSRRDLARSNAESARRRILAVLDSEADKQLQ